LNETLLRHIAEQIAREQFLLQWPIYALMVMIALVVGFAAAFLGAYAKKRGESYATKADFDNLLKQSKATATVAEEVKAAISHADWAARELKTLRRMKLEELLQAVHEVQAWQDLNVNFRIYNSGTEPGASPLPKVERVAGLYFPELGANIYTFSQQCRKMTIELVQAHRNVAAVGDNVAAQIDARQRFSQQWCRFIKNNCAPSLR